MKFFSIFLTGVFINIAATAQDSWKVCLDKKTVLKTSVESEEKNVVHINAADLKNKNGFIVTYTGQTKKKDWERTIMIYDENDRELNRQKGSKLELSDAALQALFQQSKTLKIYTWALPTDPKLKAAVRVRRVHLCTLILD
ncbi:MAG: hypothetical protein ACTHOF_06270 [Flavisolibacter sp.]